MTLRILTILSVCFLLLFSCKRINPDKPTFVGETTDLPKALSHINLSLSIPLSMLETQLNQNLKELLFSERGLELGNGLFSDMDITKTGNLRLSTAENGKVRVSLPIFLDGKVILEKKIFGQAVSAALPFKEALVPQISFRPRIDENWGIQIDQLEIESWGKSLKYDLMGYQIDVEPMIKKHVKSIMENQLVTTALSNLNLKSIAEKAWTAYSKPLHISNEDWKMVLVTIPEKIRVKENFTSDQHLVLNLGLDGEVFSHTGALPNRPQPSLPKISPNENTENKLDITLPLVITYASMDQWLTKEMVGNAIRIDSKTQLLPTSFATQSFGNRALVKMEFIAKRAKRKDLSGELFLVGTPVYSPEREAIVFDNIDFDLNTENFLTNSARWLKRKQILNAIKKQAVYPIGEYIEEARQELDAMGSWQTEFANFGLEKSTLTVEGIYTTPEDVRLYLKSTGDIRVTMKQ
jgi:hypothetical protein